MLQDPYNDLKSRVLQAAYKLIAAGYRVEELT